MKILIYGANGWIGGQFIQLLNDVEYVCGKSRVDNENELKNEISEHKPTHIISFIGRTHGTIGDKVYGTIDYLEQKGKLPENIRDNLFAPLMLAALCNKHDIHYTYLGTGCIFKYDDEHPYGFDEKSLPNFF